MTLQEPPTEKTSRKKWKVNVLRDRCKGCGFCIEFCPQNTLRFSDEHNSRGNRHPVLNEEGSRCVGCLRCEMGCPDIAIYITED